LLFEYVIRGISLGSGTEYDEFGKKKYSGQYKAGQRHGRGTDFYPNENVRYDGNWRHNRRQGKGTLFDTDGVTVLYEGFWVDDERASSE
jgi:antitoxin component YwqK of YwqJK toxin-antitoxin module